MKSSRIVSSKIYRFLDYLLRLVILNFLIVIPSFSFLIIVTMILGEDVELRTQPLVYLSLIPTLLWLLPSVVASSDVIRQFEIDKTNTVIKDFFKSLKRNYLKSLLFTVIFAVVGILLLNSISFFFDYIISLNYTVSPIIYILGLALSIAFLIIFLVVAINIVLVMIYFTKLRIIEIVKLACIMAFKDLLMSIIIIILIAILMSLNLVSYIVMIVGGFSLPCYILVKLSIKKYIRIYHKVEN